MNDLAIVVVVAAAAAATTTAVKLTINCPIFLWKKTSQNNRRQW